MNSVKELISKYFLKVKDDEVLSNIILCDLIIQYEGFVSYDEFEQDLEYQAAFEKVIEYYAVANSKLHRDFKENYEKQI